MQHLSNIFAHYVFAVLHVVFSVFYEQVNTS